MKKILSFVTVLIMAVILSSVAFAAATPGINLLTGTTEPQTFDNLTSLPSSIINAELSESPFAGETGKVLHANAVATYSTIQFKFDPALDRNRPYRISFKVYKKADEGYGIESTQLWIMKNGAAGWQIAKNIGGLSPNNPSGWYSHDYVVSTFGTLVNTSTNAIDETDINYIMIEWKYDSSTTCLNNENVYVDDVSIIPAYKFTYLDEDGTEIKTSYENTTESTFSPLLLKDDMDKGIIGWSVKNDGTVDDTINLKNEDVTLYAVYDNSLKINLSADKTLLTASGDKANLETSLWHRNGTDGITVSYSVAEGSSYVTLNDNGDGTATVTAKAEGLAKILCTSSTGESEYIYILCNFASIEMPTVTQTVPTINAGDWLYDHKGATYNETEAAWEVIKRTDVVKSDDGAGNIVYYNNGFLSKSANIDTSTYKYLLFRVKADKATSFQVAVRVGSTYKYAYPSTSATNGEYVDLYADIGSLATQAGGSTIVQYVLGITNNQNNTVYIKDITLSNIPTYEPEIPEVKSIKVISKVSEISDDAGSADVEAALFCNQETTASVAWKSSSDCVAIKNLGNGKATLMAMGDGTATITAYASDDGTICESFEVEVTGQREKQAVYDIRILFWGASTTKHAPSSSIGWYGDWGMAASAEENDYVHKLVSYLEEEFYPSKVTFEVIAASTLDVDLTSCTDATKDWTKHVQYLEIEETIKKLKPNIIVTAMTGNMGASTPVDVAYNAYEQFYDMMYSYCPDAIIVAQHCGLSCNARNDELIEQLDAKYSNKIFYDYHVNPTMKLDPSNLATEYADIHSGVAAHWGDKGHNLVATTCFNLISPDIPANIEAEYIYIPEEIEITGDTKVDEKGASLQLGIKVTPNDASADVVWSVDNSNIAIISKNGLLSPLANGTVIVTAASAYDDKIKDTHTVVLSNQLDNFTLTYASGTTDTVTGLPASDDYASGEYTLSALIPLRDCYTFVGWGLTEGADEAVTTVNVTKPTTVYALWKKTEGFEFDGEYDEAAGFVYGFDIESGFHNSVSGGVLKTVCTAGAKVTFKSPKLDIENKDILSFALTSAYTDENGKVELKVKTTSEEKTYVFPLASKDYTTYVADISALSGNVTGVEIYVNTVPADNSMFEISLDFIRFTPVTALDKKDSEFVISDGDVYVSSLAYGNYTAIETGAEGRDLVVAAVNNGYSVELSGVSSVYIHAEEEANVTVNVLDGGYNYRNSVAQTYSYANGEFTQSELDKNLTAHNISEIRTVEPMGLRAKASVDILSSTDENVVEYGFAVARLDSITNGKIKDVVLDSDYIDSKLVLYGKAYSKDESIHKVYSSEGVYEFFTAVLINIPMRKDALMADIVFRPYIKYADGSYVYGSKVIKNVYEVALEIYYYSSPDEETKNYLKQILDICGDPLDKDLAIDIEDLYKD